MSDLFHPEVPFEFIDEVLSVCAVCRQHTFLVLTKRLDKANIAFRAPSTRERISQRVLELDLGYAVIDPRTDNGWPLPNLWLGVSVCNQEEADEKIPILLEIPAAKRFLSIEPMLGPIDFYTGYNRDGSLCSWLDVIDWATIGCESGAKRRPCDIENVRSVVQQCQAASVPCFVKQLSINGKVSHDMSEWPEDLRVREYPK
jgi:protein gp37